MRRIPDWRLWGQVGAVLLGALLTGSARAQDPDDGKRGVARVSLLNGEVSVQRGDSGDWVAATVNTPVATNDHLATSPNSRAEVQFDAATALRIGGDADVKFTQLEAGRYQMAVARGTVTFRVLRASAVDIEVDTPSVSVRPSRQGTYRIAVNGDGQSEITARSGDVEVFTPQGSEWVRSGQTLLARGSASNPEFQIVPASAPDDWDRWNDSRDQTVTRSVSPRYVGPGVYGTEDLDPYGSWVNVPNYGYVWRPVVAAGWAPYRQGRWVWEDWYGWTWVSYEPWGWAPYHYGRWFYEPAFGWCWYPGAIGAPHYWSPGLVAFFGFGGGGVALGFGNVGWVPLAPYEVFHPWWGRAYYGGPAYVNRSINITNVNIVNSYRNARVTSGVTAVSGADFRAGRFNNFVGVSGEQLRTASVANGPIPMSPSRSNLQFAERQNTFVPRSTANARFFTHQQPNPAQSVPLAEQRRGLEQAASSPAVRNESSGWQRFGDTRGSQSAARPEPAASTVNRGWTRFGDPARAQQPEITTTRPTQPAAPSGNRNAPQALGFANQAPQGGASNRTPSAAPPAGGDRPSSTAGSSAPRGKSFRGKSGSGPRGGKRGGHSP